MELSLYGCNREVLPTAPAHPGPSGQWASRQGLLRHSFYMSAFPTLRHQKLQQGCPSPILTREPFQQALPDPSLLSSRFQPPHGRLWQSLPLPCSCPAEALAGTLGKAAQSAGEHFGVTHAGQPRSLLGARRQLGKD